jgi:uncharacterized protein (DUF2141 family)
MKKTVSLFAALALASTGTASAAELVLEIEGYKSEAGRLMAAVFDNEAAYESGEGAYLALQHSPVVEGHRISFGNLPEGEYAVKVFHDENGNGELDTNGLGMPKEHYGFSGNRGLMGPPRFDQAKVHVKEAVTVNINLR